MVRKYIWLAVLASSSSFAAESHTQLYMRGNVEYDARKYAECAATFEAAHQAAPDERRRENYAYSAACCSALAGKKDAAFAQLQKAVNAGFRDSAHLGQDEDLKTLRGDPRWAPFAADVKAREAKYLASVNGELKALFDADQADRSGPTDWSVVSKRDAERRTKVDAIVKAGGAKAGDDYFHAAMVFQHGMTADEIARAHELAAKALEVQPDHARAKWLYAASKDRLLMRQGKPQLYGTQFTTKDGKTELYPVDPSITDAERARYNVPPIAEAHAKVVQMNAHPPAIFTQSASARSDGGTPAPADAGTPSAPAAPKKK